MDTIGQKIILHMANIIHTLRGVNHKNKDSAREDNEKESEQDMVVRVATI